MTERNKRWIYSTVEASENKSIDRSGLSGKDIANQVVGIDGSVKYGMRPSTGFRLYRELNITQDFNSTVGFTHTKTSIVTDFFPVQFHISEGNFGQGFVYRVKSASNNYAAIYMDYCPTATVDSAAGWRTVLLSKHAASPTAADISPTAKMDVASVGRHVMIFMQGMTPRIFYINNAGGTFTHKVFDSAIGKSPKFQSLLTSGGANTAHDGRMVLSLTGTPVTGLTDSSSKLSSGDYSFAYYFYNTQTGRRSPLSEISQILESDTGWGTADKYVNISVQYNSELWDQVYIFRSVKTQAVGGTYNASILHLDTIWDTTEPTGAGGSEYTENTLRKNDTPSITLTDAAGTSIVYKNKIGTFQLDDIALTMQDVYLDKVIYEEETPRGKSCEVLDGTLLVADPQGGTPPTTNSGSIAERERNVGELRWSSVTEKSPELFPINNKYSPEIFQNRIEALSKVGDFAVGFSRDRLYHIRREGLYLKIEDLHAGFGIAGLEASSDAGPLCYFVSHKGLKAVANNGQLDDVRNLDNLLAGAWRDNLDSLRMAYDPYASCLFILNPVQDQSVCMWFSTGRISEFHDVPFTDVKKGVCPLKWSSNSEFTNINNAFTTTDTMVERAFFLQNADSITASEIPTNWKPRVYILDIDRNKTAGANATAISGYVKLVRTLDIIGDGKFSVAANSVTASGNTFQFPLESGSYLDTGTSKAGGTNGGQNVHGAKAYVVACSNPDLIGEKFTVLNTKVTSGGSDTTAGGASQTMTVVVSNKGWPVGLNAAGVTFSFCLSPMYVNWVGGSLPMTRMEDGMVQTSSDMFRNKQISSIGCHFIDVSGGYSGSNFYEGEAYKGSNDDPSLRAIPSDFSGSIIGSSIETGETAHYAAFKGTDTNTAGRHGIQDSVLAPGFRSYISDLDYKLMSIIVRGRSSDTDTSERSTS